MQRRTKACLYDILNAVHEMKGFVAGLNYSTFEDDLKTIKAVEREFEIIGEALNRIKQDEDFEILEKITDAYKIIGTRNILAHGYDQIDYAVLWEAVMTGIPLLESEVGELLGGE